MNLKEPLLIKLYRDIANGDADALEFIKLWVAYAHKFDDLVDEEFNLEKLVCCNNELTRLLTCMFFQRHQSFLVGHIYLSAESYVASEDYKLSGRYEERLMGEFLSHDGNNVLLVVALITGGYEHLKIIAPRVRKLTYLEHPIEERNV